MNEIYANVRIPLIKHLKSIREHASKQWSFRKEAIIYKNRINQLIYWLEKRK